MSENLKAPESRSEERKGTGALCAEAQADGVPCTELGKDCAVCGRAVVEPDRPADGEPMDGDADEHAGWGV